MKTTANSAARLGIIKTRSGHYAVWCKHGSSTITKLEATEAKALRASLLAAMDGKTPGECSDIWTAECRSRAAL